MTKMYAQLIVILLLISTKYHAFLPGELKAGPDWIITKMYLPLW